MDMCPIIAAGFPLGVGRWALLTALAVIAAVWLYGDVRRLATRGRVNGANGDLATLSPWRRGALAVTRLAGVAAIAWMLTGPTAIHEASPVTGKPRLLILADASASMAREDASSGDGAMSRWEAISRAWLDPALTARLEEHAELTVMAFDQHLRPEQLSTIRDLPPAGESTRLFASIREATAYVAPGDGSAGGPNGARGGVVLVLSDGHDTQQPRDPSLAAELVDQRWRLFASAVGHSVGPVDASVRAWADAVNLLAHQSTRIHAAVSHVGLEGRQARVELLLDGQLVDVRELPLERGRIAETSFHVTPEARRAGDATLHGYTVRVQPMERELNTTNNQRHVFVHVSRERIRALLLEGEPYWDTRFLIRALAADAQVDLTVVHRLGDRTMVTQYGGDGQSSGAPPDQAFTTLEALRSYDVVLLGRGLEQLFLADSARVLADYARQGGALVLARGRPFSPVTDRGRRALEAIQPVLPVTWGDGTLTRLRLMLADTNREHALTDLAQFGDRNILLSRLPDMLAASRLEGQSLAAVMLLAQRSVDTETPTQAALVHQPVGRQGRVAAVLTDGLWQWAMLPSRLEAYDSVHQVFWSRFVRWLAMGGQFLPGQDVALSLDRREARQGETVAVFVSSRMDRPLDPAARLEAIGPDGAVTELKPQRLDEEVPRWKAALNATQPGVHQVRLVLPGGEPNDAPRVIEQRLAVHDPSLERSDPAARPDVLRDLAQATGGQCLGLGESERLIEALEELEKTRTPVRRVEPAFNDPTVVGAALLLLAGEWYARRRMGLT